MIKMIPVASSLIKAVGYDPEKEELQVQFHKGGTYTYRGVTRPVYDAMMDAPSVGHFFLANVKKQYECIKENA